MSTYMRLVFLSLIIALPLAACGSLSAQQPATPTVQPLVALTASGSGTITAVLKELAPAFETATPGYKLKVLSSTSTGGGVTGILEGVLDLAAMARAPKDEETAKNIKYFEMGLVGQAIVTHPTVTDVTSLTNQKIIDIFSGKIINWSEVGGPDLKIVLYVRDEDDASTKGLRKAVLDKTPFPDSAKTLTSQEDMIVSVEGTPGAIGIAGWPAVLATKAKIQAIGINGFKPNDASYPILASAGIGYMAEREGDIQPLTNWLSSTEGQSALKMLGFVPVK